MRVNYKFGWLRTWSAQMDDATDGYNASKQKKYT